VFRVVQDSAILGAVALGYAFMTHGEVEGDLSAFGACRRCRHSEDFSMLALHGVSG
jgi:hypothetical protein